MARKRKIKVDKKRVRFLSLDYYRTIVTGKTTVIEGIDCYFCDDNSIKVHYTNGFVTTYFVNEGEKQLKQVVKIINAYLGGFGDGTQQLFT